MNALNLDRDTALRIALAGRAMPDVKLGSLVEVLVERLGNPLTVEALARITVTDLKTGLGSADGEEDGEDIGIGLDAMKLAVRILWGETEDDDSLPVPGIYSDSLPGSIRVAISSNSGANLDGHYGSCLRYLVYEVSTEEVRLIDVRSAAEADLSDDRNAFRAGLISDCQVLYVVSVGGPAAAKIINAGIYPIKKIEGGEAATILADLQCVMSKSPPPWLAKILGIDETKRLKNYRGEEAQEAV
jgi:nitrogen fixation protein NifX